MTTNIISNTEVLAQEVEAAFRGWLNNDLSPRLDDTEHGRFLLDLDGTEPLLFRNGAFSLLLGARDVNIEIDGKELDGGVRVATLTPDSIFTIQAIQTAQSHGQPAQEVIHA